MSNTNTGGPAFPVLHWISGESTGAEEGMTLRDYFAAKAMQVTAQKHTHEGDVSRRAYKIADAMLKERGA